MAQTTAKTVEDVLRWVETTPHHFASVIDEPGFFILRGHGDKLRIPAALQKKAMRLVEPARDRFDSRMYRATKAGRARLRRADRVTTPQIIMIGGRPYEKFILPPRPVNDGTVRCITCGQIDEPEYHDDALCEGTA